MSYPQSLPHSQSHINNIKNIYNLYYFIIKFYISLVLFLQNQIAQSSIKYIYLH